MKNDSKTLIPIEIIERRICLIRGMKVMLDSDLAFLYKVPTKALNLAVKRNRNRFPSDFTFQLNNKESEFLRLQIETSKKGRGGRRYLPHAFTEQGVAMLSSVLKSERAVQVNIAIMRAFVKLREIMATHKDLARKIENLEKKYNKHDRDIQIVFQAIKQLIDPPAPKIPKEPMGFRDRSKDKKQT